MSGSIDTAPTASTVPKGSRARSVAPIETPILCGVLRAFDLVWIAVSGLLSLYCYDVINPENRFDPQVIGLIGLVFGVAATALFGSLGLYEFSRFALLGWTLKRLLVGWGVIILAGLLIAFLTKTSAYYSRIWLMTWSVVGATGLVAVRLALARMVKRWTLSGRLRRRVAIIGAGSDAMRLVDELRAYGGPSISLAGLFDEESEKAPAEPGGLRLGDIEALMRMVRESLVDEIIIALPCTPTARIGGLVERLRALPIDLRLWIDLPTRQLGIRNIEWRQGVPLAALADRPLKNWSALWKRLEDVSLAAAALLVLGPLMLAIAAAVRLGSRGPALFRQRRFGFNNEIIEVLKFRTLYTDQTDHDGRRQVALNDPRITRIGRFLRRTSLDELPQLFNVLAGSMSIVGPRPHPVAMRAPDRLYHEAVRDYFARHRVRPGITGLAQISGFRGPTQTLQQAQERVRLDLEYIDRWSLALDFKIMLRTFAHLHDRNAC